MAVRITRKDKSAGELRQEAARCRDGKAARRMLAIALVLDGVDRKTAAENCGIGRRCGIGPTVYHRAVPTHVGDSQAVRSLTQCGEPMRFAMAAASHCGASRRGPGTRPRAVVCWRWPSTSRTDASTCRSFATGCMRFNARGPDGLVMGVTGRRSSTPITAAHWRRLLRPARSRRSTASCVGAVALETFAISLDETTVGRELKALGFAKISARPRRAKRAGRRGF